MFATGTVASYWAGVAGAVIMGLLFLYSVRKHFKFMRGKGAMKWWFIAHMILGILGPMLILLHTDFHTHSLNGAWAYYSMIVVVSSGLTGRFLFRRANRGLHGGKTTLEAIQADARDEEAEAYTALAFAPTVEAELLAFEAKELAPCTWYTCIRQVWLLPVKQQVVYYRCSKVLWQVLKDRQELNGWDNEALMLRYSVAQRLTMQYLNAVVKVAQFKAYTELFALWHVIHVPFLFTLVVSTIIHIYAVLVY
jgi:hypothetical protein